MLKFVSSVNCDPVDYSTLEELCLRGSDGIVSHSSVSYKEIPHVLFEPSTKVKYGHSFVSSRTYVPYGTNKILRYDRSGVMKDLFSLFHEHVFHQMFGDQLPRILYPLLPEILPIRKGPDYRTMKAFFRPIHPGVICSSQEGGGKLRVFAAPNLALQCLLHPLHKSLELCLKSLKTDFTHNQTGGSKRVQEFLLEGKTVHCFDLSNATDRFPRSVSILLLRHMGYNPSSLDSFEFLSSQPWLVHDSLVKQGFPKQLSWKVGQPLGLKSSFFMFALSHNALLRGIEIELFGEVLNEFAIVGDDVCISNDKVAKRYLEVMELSSIPISLSKSVISNRLAEFVGKLITRKKILTISKHKKYSGNSLVSYAQIYGESMRKTFEKSLPDPIRMLSEIPRSIGGPGFPTSKSLDESFYDPDFYRLFVELSASKTEQKTLGAFAPALLQKICVKLGISWQLISDLYADTISSYTKVTGAPIDAQFSVEHQARQRYMSEVTAMHNAQLVMQISSPDSEIYLMSERAYDSHAKVARVIESFFIDERSLEPTSYLDSLSKSFSDHN